MNPKPIRILLIEDNAGDARLIREMLVDSRTAFELDWVDRLSPGLERLDPKRVDVVLLDLSLPDSHGLATFTQVFERASSIPVVVLSGLDDERLAAEAVHTGAQDYLVKGQVDGNLLGRSVRYAIERKQAERALQESEARFRRVFEDGPVGMVLVAPDARVLRANDAFCHMLGYAESELVGRAMTEITHPDDVEETRHCAQRLFGGEVPSCQLEGRYLTRRGDVIWANLSASVVRDPADAPLYAIAIVENVTERKQAVENLERSEKLLSEAQQITHLGSWVWDVATNRVEWSDELYRIYGLEPGGFGATFEAYLDRVHPADRPAVRRHIEQALVDHQPFAFDERVLRPDGTERILHSRGEVVIDGSGRPVRMVGACLDITERKLAELELAKARDAALQSARLKSAFLANMSHEIRTPLNVILGYNAVIADEIGKLDRDNRRALIERVQRAGDRLMATIDGILDISKIETGNFEVRPVRLDLAALIERQIEDFRMLASEKGLSLGFETEETGKVVRFDEYCLSHALMNLLQNAIKFTQEGGVTVRLARDAEGTLCLSVHDTGVGIDAAYLSRIFDPFTQEESGYTRRFEGSGLGLTLTREYLELNGARISVESEKGRGSVFRIHLPRSSEEIGATSPVPSAPERPRRREAPAAGSDRPIVLLVEDDADTQAYMMEVLGRRFEVLVASNGEEFRVQLDTHLGRIPIVLMDLSLRGTEDGLALTRYLRSQERWKDVSVIVVTAHAFPEDRLKALAAGCNAYLAKPFHRHELLSMMDDLLDAARSPGRSSSSLQ